MIAVIDYGGGNLGSLLASFIRRSVDYRVVDSAAELEAADAAILPGDGAFGATMEALRLRRLDQAILRDVFAGRQSPRPRGALWQAPSPDPLLMRRRPREEEAHS